MFRRLTRGKDSSPAKTDSQNQPKKEQKPQDAEGFLCPMCMARLPGPAELQSHFERVHSEGGVASNDNVSFSTESPSQVNEKLIDIDDDDETDIGQKSKLQIEGSGDSQEEVILLQQELKELTTAIREEKWYTGQLKDELDKVTAERNKLEEEREMFQQEYDSKLRSAEDSYLQVAQENEKLRDEVRYADVKSLKERDTKLNSEIDSLKMDLSQEREMRSAVEEANKHMMEQIERKDKAIDDLRFQLSARPTSDNVGVLENEIKSLKGQIQTLGKENEKNSKVEMDKFKQTVEELKSENTKQQLMIKELDIEKTAKVEQVNSIQNALTAALETNKQAQQQTQEKKQQIIDLQHETREAQASVKEKTAFIAHLERQLQELKTSMENEMKEKQSLQQKIRSLGNTIDAGSIASNEKENKLREMETLLAKEKTENQRLENERSDLVAKIEAGAGVETAINQLRQEKEKLIEGIAKLEEEVAAQSNKHSVHLNELRDEKSKLKDDLESLKNDKNALEKKLKATEDEVNMKLQLIEQLKTNLREKTDELYKQESDRSSEKITFEKEISDIKSSLQSKSNETIALEQKVSKISSDLSNTTSSKLEIEEQLVKQREENKLLEDNLTKAGNEISGTAKLLSSVQEELAKEKSDRSKESDSFQTKLTELVEESDRKDKNIKELNEELSARNSDIAQLREQADEYTKRLNMMSAEFVTFRNNEALLNTTIQNLELEFGNQKNALTVQMEALISKGKETETKFETEIENRQKEFDTLRSSLEEEMKQLRENFAEKELEYQEKLKEKDGELYFITESSKETVSGYEKSVALLEGTLKDEKENVKKLEKEISKLQEEKLVLAESLETKDTTLHDLQRKLEVAEVELKKKCESCKNYEIQLCRFQETHKEQIITVTKLEGEIGGLRQELKASSEKCASLDEEFQTFKNESDSKEASLKMELEQAKEVNSVLDARVLELDDELKEAYNKFDNLKSELSMMSEKMAGQEESERKLTEEKAYLENEITNLKIVEEDLRKAVEKEKELADVRYEEIRMQKLDVENQLKDAENVIEKEKDKSVQAKEAMIKMQNVMKEKMEAIESKLDNIEREKDDMKKANEESEARLNMETRSMKENLISSRKEVESGKLKINELHNDISNMERERENLRGDVAVMEVQIRNINDEKRALTERVLESEEAHKRTKDRLSETNRRLEQSLAALQELGQENQSIQMQQNFKLTRQWQDDSLVTNCKGCDKLFSLTIRKHHCRHCGSIFCNECSNNYTQVAASKKPVRVCSPCYSELTSIRGRRVSAASMT